MKTLKKIIRVIIATIITLIVVLNVYNFINIKILNKDLSTIFGYSVLEVVSGSMKPTIEVGELIVIDTNEKNYKKDDIVTFYDVNGAFVTHRIVSIDEDKMITKGDNNDSKDDATDVDKIVGKYVCKIPYLGTVLSIIQKPVILFLILVIGILYSYLVSTEEPKEKKIKTHTKKLSNRKQKQLLRKQEKQDFKEFKQWKKEQLKKQEMEEFLEFRRMKEEQRQEKEEQQTEEIIEEEISNQTEISLNTNLDKRRKPRKKHKSHKQQKRINQKKRQQKHKSKKHYKYNQTNQKYNQRR